MTSSTVQPRDRLLTRGELLQTLVRGTYGIDISYQTFRRWLERSGVPALGNGHMRPRYSVRNVQRWLELEILGDHYRAKRGGPKAPAVRGEIDSPSPSEDHAEAHA